MHGHHGLALDDQTLHRLYVDEKRSLAEIGRLYGKHPNQIRRLLIRAAIPTRSVREGTILSGKYGVHSEAHRESLRRNIAKARANITDESRRKQSETRKARKIPAPNKGKKWTEETRAKHATIRATPEFREKLSAAQRGEKGHNWKGGAASRSPGGWEWRRIRAQVYERDNWTCQDCGRKCLNTRDSKTRPKRKIQCHHIIRRRDGGGDTLDNLVTLCMSCHHRRERRYDDALFA